MSKSTEARKQRRKLRKFVLKSEEMTRTRVKRLIEDQMRMLKIGEMEKVGHDQVG